MKRLIFRLSSLGDLVLSQSVLEPPYSGETHWVVAKEFEELVRGNPKINKTWSFDRRASRGFFAWLSFLADLRREGFTEILDIHSTLRTQIARLYFLVFAPQVRWRKISKERARRAGYEIFKRAWPISFRPTHFSRKCALLAGGYGNERPNLRWLVGTTAPRTERVRIAFVPSSAWPGKEWPTERYRELVARHRIERSEDELVILGTRNDRAAAALRDELIREGIPFTDEIGRYGLSELAAFLSACTVVIGSDTGLLHLAEAVGTPVITIFGPTRSDFGFGPLGEKSKALQSPLWCSPCSKDGSLCFRSVRRYECLRRIDAKTVEEALKILLNQELESS